MTNTWFTRSIGCWAVGSWTLIASSSLAWAQQTPNQRAFTLPAAEKLGDNLFRIGQIRVDTAKREIRVGGKITGANLLEFLACTQKGFKAYESAIETDTDALTFNLALILIGLDKANGVPTKRHFDPVPPQGDPVEVWVEWEDGGEVKRVPGEELIYDRMKRQTLTKGGWVYTGSIFSTDGSRYLAQEDGVLIGFVHTPAPIIENSASDVLNRYGAAVINPALNLKPGTAVTVLVRALPKNPAAGPRN